MLDFAAGEYKRALLVDYYLLPRGSRVAAPKLVQLVKNIENDVNVVAKTTMALQFGKIGCGVSLEKTCRAFRIAEAIVRAQFPVKDDLSFDDLQALEMEIECSMNPIQWKARGDHSTATLTSLLEKIDQSIDVLTRLRAWVVRKLYGGNVQ